MATLLTLLCIFMSSGLCASNKTAMWFSYGGDNATHMSYDANFITSKHLDAITHMVLGCKFFVCGYQNLTNWGNIDLCIDAIEIYKNNNIIIYNDLSKGNCGINGERNFLTDSNNSINALITIANKYGFNGWNFDLEASGSNQSDSYLLTNYLKIASDKLKENNLEIVIDVGPPITDDVTDYVQYAKFMTMSTYHTGNQLKKEEYYFNISNNYSSNYLPGFACTITRNWSESYTQTRFNELDQIGIKNVGIFTLLTPDEPPDFWWNITSKWLQNNTNI